MNGRELGYGDLGKQKYN